MTNTNVQVINTIEPGTEWVEFEVSRRLAEQLKMAARHDITYDAETLEEMQAEWREDLEAEQLTAQLLARKEDDTVDSEPRADYNDRLQQLNYNFPSLPEEARDLLQLAAGYATTEEWKQLEATYKLESTPSDF